jgi:hypothetical protein
VHYRAALRAVLDVSTDAELGFRRSRSGTSGRVNRKTFLKASIGAAAGMLVEQSALSSTNDPSELIAALSGPTGHYRRMESAVSSQQLAPAVEAHRQLAAHTVANKLRTSTGFAVLAEISGLAAWLAVDRGDHATARRRYVEAIKQSERAHHPLLMSYMTASLGSFAVEAGDARQGLAMLQRATAQLDPKAPDAARAWLASLHAVAHAEMGDRAAAASALRSAEKLASRQRGEPHWPWVFVFDAAKAARYQAGALARLGDLRAARAAFGAADAALTAPKPRAVAQLEQAQALAHSGQVGEACALAAEALSVGRDYGSERITSRVRDFRTRLRTPNVDTDELDSALSALYEQEIP